MCAPIFSPGPATDPSYINLRACEAAWLVSPREFTERLWERYHELADTNFLTEIRTNFQARFWEMYLTCALLDHAAERGYQVSCPKPGPDILLEHQGKRCWVEAVIVTNGAPGLADTVVEPDPIGKIPEEKLVLRYANAIREKHQKYAKYLGDGTVRKDDGFVIAMNSAHLAYRGMRAEQDAPRFLMALYPIGQYHVLFDRRTNDIVGHGNHPRFHIAKANKAEVQVQTFVQPGSEGISAVLCSFADAAWHAAPLGNDFELAYNPMGCSRIPEGMFPAKRSWTAELNDDGGQLTGITLI